ncbi:MAG: OsmC family protein [Aeromicrobium erythreum]
MSEDSLRSVGLERIERSRYAITNARGGRLEIGTGDDADFTPVELLLAAIAGCTAIDVDLLTTKRAEPEHFRVEATGHKQAEHVLDDLQVLFDVAFGDDEAGRTAQERVAGAIATSHDRLCTVSRTVERGTPVESRER